MAAFVPMFAAGSARAETVDEALDFDVVYTSEAWRNFSGGLREDSIYLDNLDATLEIDAEQLWGLDGTRVFLYALYNNGRSLSGRRVGDAQVVSNIETGVEALRLYEAWIETPVGDSGSLLFGLFDLNSEFDVLDSSGLFIHSAHGIGTDFGQSGRAGPSIFPLTSLALRFHWQWDERWGIRAAIFDGVPGDPEDPGATAIQLGDGDGALLVTELEWADEGRRVLAGAWRYTADFEAWPDPATPGTTVRDDGNGGLYLRAETALGGTGSGVRAFARVGVADERYNPFSRYLGAGVTWDGPSRRALGDTFGMAIAWAETSDDYRRATGAESREINLEITYRLPLHERLVVQPDIQYVIDPGADPSLDNAWVAGLRFELTLLP